MVCHAPGKLGPLGTLFIESRRHFLDYSEMTPEEAASLGNVMKKMYGALRTHVADVARIYQLGTMEGQPHFHSWIVPRRQELPEKGLKFLARDDSCSDEEAEALADKLRAAMK
jgi:diadenosine tetraphosphate (Ap4A) HIT family hydrolase